MRARYHLLLVALTASGAVACSNGEQKKVALPGNAASASSGTVGATTATTTVSMTSGKLEGRSFTGTFEAERSSKVATNVGGIVRKVYVKEGDSVKAGDRLVDINGADYRLRVRQAKAAVASAKAQVDTIETEYNRARRLLADNAIAPSQVDQLSGKLTAARAGLQQAEVGLDMAQKAARDALVRAPYDGVVTEVRVAEGDFAAPGPQALVKIDDRRLYLRVHLPEQYLGDVSVGQPLEVRIPSQDRTIELKIARINPRISSRSRSFDVLAEVPDGGTKLRPGMFAEVKLGEADEESP